MAELDRPTWVKTHYGKDVLVRPSDVLRALTTRQIKELEPWIQHATAQRRDGLTDTNHHASAHAWRACSGCHQDPRFCRDHGCVIDAANHFGQTTKAQNGDGGRP